MKPVFDFEQIFETSCSILNIHDFETIRYFDNIADHRVLHVEEFGWDKGYGDSYLSERNSDG